MTHLARIERDALCDTLAATGPNAPTLCSPWTTAQLAAHLVVRERRPDLAAGIWVRALAPRTDEAMAGYAATPWPELVQLVRSGPPVWSPTRVAAVDNSVNFVEFVVHHEDVLRGDEAVGPRRQLPAHVERGVWKALTRSARLLFRRSATGVVLRSLTGETVQARSGSELGTVVLEGAPLELLLAAYGRRRVAEVEAMGTPEAVAALWAGPVGLS